jgi:hypothetical protein
MGYVLGYLLGASLCGVWLYIVVQRLVRKRPMTGSGLAWSIGISCAVASPSALRDVADQKRKDQLRADVSSSKAAMLSAFDKGCLKAGSERSAARSLIAECTSLSPCLLERLETRYPNDETWMEFVRRFEVAEATARAEIEAVGTACTTER